MQFPVLWHGENIVPDSSAIVEYLFNTYPSQMASLTPTDPVRCGGLPTPTCVTCKEMFQAQVADTILTAVAGDRK